jgi:hypothetical protein
MYSVKNPWCFWLLKILDGFVHPLQTLMWITPSFFTSVKKGIGLDKQGEG